jgi:hypothetical protein
MNPYNATIDEVATLRQWLEEEPDWHPMTRQDIVNIIDFRQTIDNLEAQLDQGEQQ